MANNEIIATDNNSIFIKQIKLDLEVNNIHNNSVSYILELIDNRIASGCMDGTISICSINLETKEWECNIPAYSLHEDTITSICQTNNTTCISSSDDKTIKIWTLTTTSITLITTLQEHTHWVNDLILLTNNHFASCSEDSSVKIWNTQNYKLITTLQEEGSIYSILQLKSNGKLITNCDYPYYSLSFWNLNSNQKEIVFEGYYAYKHSHIIELPNGNIAVSTDTKGYVIVVINIVNYIVEKIIKLEGYIVWESSLCVINDKSFAYMYEGNIVQICIDDNSVVYKENNIKGINGFHGIVSVCNNNYFVVDNNNKGYSIIQINYN